MAITALQCRTHVPDCRATSFENDDEINYSGTFLYVHDLDVRRPAGWCEKGAELGWKQSTVEVISVPFKAH